MADPGAYGHFDGALDDARTVRPGMDGSGAGDAATEGIKDGSTIGASLSMAGPGIGLAGTNALAGGMTAAAMGDVKNEIAENMGEGGKQGDNQDKTENPAFTDAGEANPPDPTPDLGGGNESSGDAGGGGDAGGEAGDAE